MFSERLENLIEAALQDGVLTDQEKVAIINRAQNEGEDISEVEIYIQSLLQKRQQEQALENKKERAIQAKEELEEVREHSKKLRKCPKCGAYVPNLSNVCPGCGFIIDTATTDRIIVLLIKTLEEYKKTMMYLYFGGRAILYTTVHGIKEEYELYPQLFDGGSVNKERGYYVYNINAVKAEASLYQDNEKLSLLLNEVAKEESCVLCDGAIQSLNEWMKDDFKFDSKHLAAKAALRTLKQDYSEFASQQIADLEERIKEAELKAVEYKENAAKSIEKKKIAELTTKCDESTREIVDLKKTNAKLTKRNDELVKKNEELEKTNNELTKKNEELARQIADLEDKLKQVPERKEKNIFGKLLNR